MSVATPQTRGQPPAHIRQGLDALRAHFIGRTDVYAVQQPDGSYRPVRRPLTDALLLAHLGREVTLGTYLGRGELAWHFVVDSDSLAGGLAELRTLAYWCRLNAIATILEDSRRGAHLWGSLETPAPAALIRRAVRGLAGAAGMPIEGARELFPKSNTLGPDQIGNPVRVPLGVHRKSGRVYPLLRPVSLEPVGATLGEQVEYVARVPLNPPERIAALAEAYPFAEPEPIRFRPADPAAAAAGGRPGDDFNARVSWARILEPHRWRVEAVRGDITHWCRPDKDHGTSATTGYGEHDCLYVFSSSTPFEPGKGYSKFAAYALLEHGSDHRAAARALRAEGYGGERPAAAAGKAA